MIFLNATNDSDDINVGIFSLQLIFIVVDII